MKYIEAFNAVAELATGASARKKEEHYSFLRLFKTLVETTSSEVSELFGRLSGVKVKTRKGSQEYGIELTATDYIWWKNEIQDGARFVEGVKAVKRAMLDRLSSKAETEKLEPKERKKLIALLEAAQEEAS